MHRIGLVIGLVVLLGDGGVKLGFALERHMYIVAHEDDADIPHTLSSLVEF